MATRPSVYGVSLEEIETKYGAADFKGALARYIVHCQNPKFSRRQVEVGATSLYIPFHKISVFRRIKFVSCDPFRVDPSVGVVVDSIHCEPESFDRYGNYLPGRFDTAIIKIDGQAGLKGMSVFSIQSL